jgi:predicted nucleotidyltransferase
MVSRDEIRRFVDQVVKRFHPSRVILFGSYAYGRPTADSDVDLMVVMRHRSSGPAVATKIRLACPRDFPMDLIVRSPAELRRGLASGDSFIQEIMSKGIVLHDAEDARMGRARGGGFRRRAVAAAKPQKAQPRSRLLSPPTMH